MKGIQAVPEILAGFIILIIGVIITLHRIFQSLPTGDMQILLWMFVILVGVILIIVGAIVINDGGKKLQ